MDALEYIIDYKLIVDEVALKKSTLFSMVENDVKRMLESMTPSQTLSFYIKDKYGRHEYVPLAADRKYTKVLWCFIREKKYDRNGVDYHIESKVTQPILNQIERTIISFYSSPEIKNCIALAISNAINTSSIVKSAVGKSVVDANKSVQIEIAKRIANHSLSDVKSEMVNQVADQVVSFLNSNMMQQVISIVGTTIATGTGKIVASKIAIVLSKSISASTLKAIVTSVIKKIGITSIAKTAIGKGVALALTTLGVAANAAFFIALIPIVAFIIKHEYDTFPHKLAKKIPTQVVNGLKDHFDEINEKIVRELLTQLSKQITNQQRKKSLYKKIIITILCIIAILLVFCFL